MNPALQDGPVTVYHGDALDVLREMADESVHCVVTSPPYWGLRDYGTASWVGGDEGCDHIERHTRGDAGRPATMVARGVGGSLVPSGSSTPVDSPMGYRDICGKCGAKRVDSQLGLEATPDEYVENMVRLFREVRRVLRSDGTCWLNLGDSYATNGHAKTAHEGDSFAERGQRRGYDKGNAFANYGDRINRLGKVDGVKPKDLVMMPARVAMALQEPYVVPTCVKAETDRAWLAATFDGEGTIGIRRFDSWRPEKRQVYQDGFVVYTSVTNSDLALLDRCVEITGYGRPAVKSGGHAASVDERGIVTRRDSYGWRQDGNAAVEIIRAIYPYLLVKRKQAIIAYTLDRLNKGGRELRGNGPVSADEQAKRALLYDLIKRSNQREDIDLPSWVEEPRQEVEPGWYLRSDIIWAKPNPMPESVTDRPTTSHEHVFLLTRSPRYFYDADAVREAHEAERRDAWDRRTPDRVALGDQTDVRCGNHPAGRNLRSVWQIATQPYSAAHFATFPEALCIRPIKAGCPEGGIVLDPFAGSGTTLAVARRLGRRAIGIELSQSYIDTLIRPRVTASALPLLEFLQEAGE